MQRMSRASASSSENEIAEIKERIDRFLMETEVSKRQLKEILDELKKKYGIKSLDEAVKLAESLNTEIENDKIKLDEIKEEIDELLSAYEES